MHHTASFHMQLRRNTCRQGNELGFLDTSLFQHVRKEEKEGVTLVLTFEAEAYNETSKFACSTDNCVRQIS